MASADKPALFQHWPQSSMPVSYTHLDVYKRQSHADEIACSRRTIYSYIDRGVFQARNIDLRRKGVYKQRKRKTTASLKDRSFRKDRSYKEFLEYIAANKSVYVVEMDTVEGAKGTTVLID